MSHLGHLLKRTLVLSVALVAIVFAGDYLVVRLRVAYPDWDALSTPCGWKGCTR